jgi:hypothetical protein
MRKQLRKHWFLTLCFIGGATILGSLWYLLATTGGNDFVRRHIERLLATHLQIDSSLEGFQIIEAREIRIPKIVGRHFASRTDFLLKNVVLTFGLRTLFSGKAPFKTLACEDVCITGRVPLKQLDLVPELPPLGCFAARNYRALFETARIDRLVWETTASGPLRIGIDRLELFLDANRKNILNIRFHHWLELKGTKCWQGNFSGVWKAQQGGLEGLARGNILARPYQTDLKVQSETAGWSVNGHIHSFSVDLASLSRWLRPLWENRAPVELTGEFHCKGAWRFNARKAFSGNLKASFRRARLVLVGFLLELLEMNADLSYQQGKIQIHDQGTRFFGSPASMSGGLDWDFQTPPRWDLAFSVAHLDVEPFLASLPWALRYSLGIPKAQGIASLGMTVFGLGPHVKTQIQAAHLQVQAPAATVDFSGNLEHVQNPGQSARWNCWFDWKTVQGSVPFLERLSLEGRPLGLRENDPVEWKGLMSCIASHQIQLDGSFQVRGMPIRLQGNWLDGACVQMTADPPYLFDFAGFAPSLLFFFSGK